MINGNGVRCGIDRQFMDGAGPAEVFGLLDELFSDALPMERLFHKKHRDVSQVSEHEHAGKLVTGSVLGDQDLMPFGQEVPRF